MAIPEQRRQAARRVAARIALIDAQARAEAIDHIAAVRWANGADAWEARISAAKDFDDAAPHAGIDEATQRIWENA